MNICDILICPVCGAPLERREKSLICRGTDKAHTYDISKEGYVNLLPPGKGRNSKSGDEVSMVRARRDFLSLGFYDNLSSEVARIISDNCSQDKLSPLTVIDSGCGEGYHTCRYVQKLSENGRPVLSAAFDASKHASAVSAKSAVKLGLLDKGGVGISHTGNALASFITGNIFSLPVRDASADAVVSMFAPIAWEESLRVLKHGGILVVAASGDDHLCEMREVLYDTVIKKSPDISAGDGFDMIARSNVTYKITLTSSKDIMNLFGMTPFCYKTSKEAVEKLKQLENLTLTVDTDFFVFKKI